MIAFLEWLEQQGKTLVIQGPQGCGKGLLASQLAKESGAFSVAHIDEITDKQSMAPRWLDGQPKTVIVEGFSHFNKIDKIKSLTVTKKLSYERRGKEPVLLDVPTFIFCTSDPDALKFGVNERRFYVIKMGVEL